MDEHISFLENLCRLCGKGLSRKADLAHKNSFKLELLVQCEINVDNDSEEEGGKGGYPSRITPNF